MSLNNLLPLAIACVAFRLAAAELPFIAGEEAAPEKLSARADDSAKVIKRWNFDESLEGWDSEKMEEYKPWSKCEPSAPGLRNSAHALKTTIPGTWNTLGPFIAVEYPGSGTHVTFAYKTTGAKGIIAQGRITEIKKQLHGTSPAFRDGEWTVQTLEPETWSPWSGNELGKDRTFATLMIYAEATSPRTELLLDDVVIWSGKDTTPPDRVRRGAAEVDLKAGDVVLQWVAPADHIAIAKFEIHRSISAEFTPNAKTLIGSTAESHFRDGGLNNFGTYYYKFVAEDAAANASEASQALKVDVNE